MKKIAFSRSLLNVNAQASLAELKSVYRNLVKEWHPDRHQPGSPEQEAAEHKSKEIIEAYHFLVSLAPETKTAGLEQYKSTADCFAITEITFKEKILEITFADGSSYEYYGVPKDLYLKLLYAPAPTRFARRHIVHQFLYRQTSKTYHVEAVA